MALYVGAAVVEDGDVFLAAPVVGGERLVVDVIVVLALEGIHLAHPPDLLGSGRGHVDGVVVTGGAGGRVGIGENHAGYQRHLDHTVLIPHLQRVLALVCIEGDGDSAVLCRHIVERAEVPVLAAHHEHWLLLLVERKEVPHAGTVAIELGSLAHVAVGLVQ